MGPSAEGARRRRQRSLRPSTLGGGRGPLLALPLELQIAAAADNLAAADAVRLQHGIDRQRARADEALVPWQESVKERRLDILLGAEIELAVTSLLELLLDALALLLVLPAVAGLAVPVAVPDALAPVAQLERIAASLLPTG